MYIVSATAPHPLLNKGWDFRAGYFPRQMCYKKDAMELCDEATRKGGINVNCTKAVNKGGNHDKSNAV